MIITSLLLLLKNTHLLIYLFLHFIWLISISFGNFVRVRVNPLLPRRHFMYFNWYLCCGLIRFRNIVCFVVFFLPIFLRLSVSYTYLLNGALPFAKNDLWLFLFDIPLRSAETLHFCCTQSARWETKNQKIKIHCLKLQVFSIVQWKKQTTTVKTRFHYTIIWRLSHDVD